MEFKKDNVASLVLALKDSIPVEFKERAQQESAKIAREGRRKLGDLRAGSSSVALISKQVVIGARRP
jgi:hypothetical protein